MAAHKGHDGQGGGRPPGSPNKATERGREAIAQFVDGNAQRLVGWLDAMALESPKDAFASFMSVVEYHIPKLQRKEVTGADGGAIQHEHHLNQSDREIIESYLNQRRITEQK